jgi:hypothetical protein
MSKIESAAAAKAGLLVERGDFGGKPTISIRRGQADKYPFTFGLAKARVLLAVIDDVRQWVSECEEKATVTAAAAITPPPATLSVEALRELLKQAESKEEAKKLPAYGKRRVKNVAARAASV